MKIRYSTFLLILTTVLLIGYIKKKEAYQQGLEVGFKQGKQMSNGCSAHDGVECEILKNDE